VCYDANSILWYGVNVQYVICIIYAIGTIVVPISPDLYFARIFFN